MSVFPVCIMFWQDFTWHPQKSNLADNVMQAREADTKENPKERKTRPWYNKMQLVKNIVVFCFRTIHQDKISHSSGYLNKIL